MNSTTGTVNGFLNAPKATTTEKVITKEYKTEVTPTSAKTVSNETKQDILLKIGHKDWGMKPSQQRNTIQYAYLTGGRDFVLTLNAENGQWRLDRQSDVIQSNGRRERSFGLCQLQEIYHAPFIWKTGRVKVGNKYQVDQAKAEKGGHADAFMNYKKHVDYCKGVRDNAIEKGRITTTFYGYNVRLVSNNGFYLY